jgi:hypothetical protein
MPQNADYSVLKAISPMFCSKNKNMCSGCINESIHHCKVQKIELDILRGTLSNSVLAPVVQHLSTHISLIKFWRLFAHLPAFNNRSRDDDIYGTARYLANTIGIPLLENCTSDRIDQPMTTLEVKQAW